MQNSARRYDQRALALIDTCLAQGRFTDEAVSEIITSFAQARRAEQHEQAPPVRSGQWAQHEARASRP